MQQYTPRSYIPRAPQIQPNIQRTNNAFNFPPARQITVNGIEKSGIPHPNLLSRNNQALMRRNSIAGHNMVERSAPQMPALLGQFLQQQQQQQPQVLQQRSQISKPEGKVCSKWSYAFLDLRSSECTCVRKSTCFVSRII